MSLYIDKVDAGRKVGKINHADGVRNHVQVEGNVPDNELQSKLADKLSYDRIGFGIMFNTLSLKAEDGVVTVGGDVRDYPSRDSAVAIVETTSGVKDVIDEINVLPGGMSLLWPHLHGQNNSKKQTQMQAIHFCHIFLQIVR